MERLLREIIFREVKEGEVEYGPEFKKANQKFDKAYHQMKERLSAQDQEKLEELTNLHICVDSLEEDASNIAAFRLGALLMMEIYNGRDS